MSGNQQIKTKTPSDKDLREDPGIGASKGTIRMGDVPVEEMEDGDNTFAGDVENDVGPNGEINPNQTGRTNK
jgi:hypothetical protein